MNTPKGYWKRMIGWLAFDSGLVLLILSIANSSPGGWFFSSFLLGLGLYCVLKGVDEEFK